MPAALPHSERNSVSGSYLASSTPGVPVAGINVSSSGGESNRSSFAGNARVETRNSAGTAADRVFNLVLFLPGGEP